MTVKQSLFNARQYVGDAGACVDDGGCECAEANRAATAAHGQILAAINQMAAVPADQVALEHVVTAREKVEYAQECLQRSPCERPPARTYLVGAYDALNAAIKKLPT